MLRRDCSSGSVGSSPLSLASRMFYVQDLCFGLNSLFLVSSFNSKVKSLRFMVLNLERD